MSVGYYTDSAKSAAGSALLGRMTMTHIVPNFNQKYSICILGVESYEVRQAKHD